tara:strand:+ start:2110 stop:2451 length:342 start_codon:yes stop_codon:yes gene_type:complete
MLKYLQFQLTEGESPTFHDVCVNDLHHLWKENVDKIVFVQNNFNEGGVLKLVLNQQDGDSLIVNYLREEIRELIEGNGRYKVIPKTFPFSKTEEGVTTSYTGTLGMYKIELGS